VPTLGPSCVYLGVTNAMKKCRMLKMEEPLSIVDEAQFTIYRGVAHRYDPVGIH